MKQVAVKVLGTEADPLDIQIQPGQTAGEVLNQLGLSGYWLSFPNSNRFFGNEEPIYASVVDGDKLVATTPAQVGAIRPDFIGA
jgi:hypothetical protein